LRNNNFLNPGVPTQPSVLISNYRPDVDGLRAIAVIAVVIFHAFPSLLPGGFVGVDMFFVISGYLITGLLIRENAEGSLKLSTFYARRIKRIFPALLLVLTCCLAAGWIFLTSEEYYSLGKYTAGGAAFLNNFMFWKAAGYFDSAAITKPLLHLWSLAIEEQFYLVWPLMILAIFKWTKIKRLSLFLLFFSSLIYSLWTANTDLVKDFYSPLTRFWELIIGGILAYELHKKYSKILHSSVFQRISAYFSVFRITLNSIHFRIPAKRRCFPWVLGTTSYNWNRSYNFFRKSILDKSQHTFQQAFCMGWINKLPTVFVALATLVFCTNNKFSDTVCFGQGVHNHLECITSTANL
jgi:hypothetical protein